MLKILLWLTSIDILKYSKNRKPLFKKNNKFYNIMVYYSFCISDQINADLMITSDFQKYAQTFDQD